MVRRLSRKLDFERIFVAFWLVTPFVAFCVAVWQLWGLAISWSDVVALVVMYAIVGLGVTVGFHRLLTHRSFTTSQPLRIALAIAGSMSIEGPAIRWVADHRRHHTFSDEEGDPHSPHVGHGGGFRGAVKGLYHAHMGWLFDGDTTNMRRYARDLTEEKAMRWVHRNFLLWVVLAMVLPFLIGLALTGSLWGGLTGLFWGGMVRVFLTHHVTWSINSACHFFGRRRFETGDLSTNFWPLALISFGEAWHHNHHAFPTSARHGLKVTEPDPSAWVIWTMAKLGLAWDVKQPTGAQIDGKLPGSARPAPESHKRSGQPAAESS